MKKLLSAVCLVAASLIFTGIANATTDTTTMPVSLTVTTQGSMSVTPMNFGSAPGGTNMVTATAVITVNVPTGMPFNIALDGGLAYDGSFSRRMIDASLNFVSYAIWKESGYANEWGDSDFLNTFPSGSSYSGTGTGVDLTITAYGTIDIPVNAVEATYSDTVTVMLYY